MPFDTNKVFSASTKKKLIILNVIIHCSSSREYINVRNSTVATRSQLEIFHDYLISIVYGISKLPYVLAAGDQNCFLNKKSP